MHIYHIETGLATMCNAFSSPGLCGITAERVKARAEFQRPNDTRACLRPGTRAEDARQTLSGLYPPKC
jgi:hypothetical protein